MRRVRRSSSASCTHALPPSTSRPGLRPSSSTYDAVTEVPQLLELCRRRRLVPPAGPGTWRPRHQESRARASPASDAASSGRAVAQPCSRLEWMAERPPSSGSTRPARSGRGLPGQTAGPRSSAADGAVRWRRAARVAPPHGPRPDGACGPGGASPRSPAPEVRRLDPRRPGRRPAGRSSPAPSSGVRSSGPTRRLKPESDVQSPGVSAQPGCISLTVMRSRAALA